MNSPFCIGPSTLKLYPPFFNPPLFLPPLSTFILYICKVYYFVRLLFVKWYVSELKNKSRKNVSKCLWTNPARNKKDDRSSADEIRNFKQTLVLRTGSSTTWKSTDEEVESTQPSDVAAEEQTPAHLRSRTNAAIGRSSRPTDSRSSSEYRRRLQGEQAHNQAAAKWVSFH